MRHAGQQAVWGVLVALFLFVGDARAADERLSAIGPRLYASPDGYCTFTTGPNWSQVRSETELGLLFEFLIVPEKAELTRTNVQTRLVARLIPATEDRPLELKPYVALFREQSTANDPAFKVHEQTSIKVDGRETEQVECTIRDPAEGLLRTFDLFIADPRGIVRVTCQATRSDDAATQMARNCVVTLLKTLRFAKPPEKPAKFEQMTLSTAPKKTGVTFDRSMGWRTSTDNGDIFTIGRGKSILTLLTRPLADIDPPDPNPACSLLMETGITGLTDLKEVSRAPARLGNLNGIRVVATGKRENNPAVIRLLAATTSDRLYLVVVIGEESETAALDREVDLVGATFKRASR